MECDIDIAEPETRINALYFAALLAALKAAAVRPIPILTGSGNPMEPKSARNTMLAMAAQDVVCAAFIWRRAVPNSAILVDMFLVSAAGFAAFSLYAGRKR